MPPSTSSSTRLSPKFHLRSALVPRDGTCVRLKEAEHLLVRGHFLALQHAAARLGDDALDQREHLLSFRVQSLRLLLTLLAQGLHDTLSLPHHLFRRLDELLIQGALLLDLFLALAPQEPVQRLGRSAHCAADCGRPPARS